MELRDSFGRTHDYLRISLTDHCNFRCVYCMPEEIQFLQKKFLMTPDEIQAIAGIFVNEFGIKKIRITGGEPLARKDAGKIIRDLSQFPVKMVMTTNGFFLDKYFDDLSAAGMKSINISLDTFQRERFKEFARRDHFEKVMENINLALQKGFSVKLNMVVMKGVNDDEISEFIRWSFKPNVHVRFIEFMPFNGNHWEWNKVYPFQEMLENISKEFEYEKLNDSLNSTAKSFRAKGAEGTFAVISTVTEHFCSTCNRLRLTAEGKIRNCLFATTEWDLLTPFRNGEDIRPIIANAVKRKEFKLGGLPEFQDEEALRAKLDQRSMVKIGG